ncbi:toxin-antitoxin system toxin subunit [Acidipropionibacterium timonense]|nr:toxin-antitoxin system toxin subunit [Acidipropionibacterium timonense]
MRWATIGFEDAGRPVELVFVRGVGEVLVVHANWLTKGFLAQMRRVR